MKLSPAILLAIGASLGASAVVAGTYLRLGLWAALIVGGAALVAFCLTVNA